MKNIFIFLILIIIVFTPSLSKKKSKKNKKKNKELDPKVGTCILTNNKASNTLKSYIFDNRDDNLRDILESPKIKLEKSDIDVIEECKNKVEQNKDL